MNCSRPGHCLFSFSAAVSPARRSRRWTRRRIASDRNTQAPPHLSQKLHDDLTKAGFTDITIMPSSFLVRAKDSQGNPVMMVINPDSLTEVTEPRRDGAQGCAARGRDQGRAEQSDPLARSEAVALGARRPRSSFSRRP